MNQPESDFLPTTNWTLVIDARDATEAKRRGALEALCRLYRHPVLAYISRKGHTPHDAEDLVQGFFEDLLSRDFLANVEGPDRKFRAFLLAAVNNYLQKQWRKARTIKRGGGQAPLSLDTPANGALAAVEAAQDLTPEQAFDREWAHTVVGTVLTQLQQECTTSDRLPVYEAFCATVGQAGSKLSQTDLVAQSGLAPNAFKVAVHRLKKRFKVLLQSEVKKTLADGDDLQEELRFLLRQISID